MFNTRNTKQGFTLVELSIVLVIIGLLIGGILAAQSMMKTARIQATIRQISEFDNVARNYQTRFNKLPGESVSPPGSLRGADDESYLGEIADFWPAMQAGGLQNPGTFTNTVATTFQVAGSTPNSPQTKINPRAGILVVDCNMINDPGRPVNCYTLAIFGYDNSNTGNNFSSVASPIMPPIDALAIDKKTDDGLPTTGNVQARVGIGGSIAVCDDTAVYDLTQTDNTCNLSIGFMGERISDR